MPDIAPNTMMILGAICAFFTLMTIVLILGAFMAESKPRVASALHKIRIGALVGAIGTLVLLVWLFISR
ncbi:hypothetical protein [Falsirhodobacter sp. alg1]|uniref:hypothetical protein n=1 Tax=Falsirhodobacter sp. alg1 TaxID=1472418 RepID=UPI0005F00A06|nr:hypothetical protein [Falsirhodobacter sp. alg1]